MNDLEKTLIDLNKEDEYTDERKEKEKEEFILKELENDSIAFLVIAIPLMAIGLYLTWCFCAPIPMISKPYYSCTTEEAIKSTLIWGGLPISISLFFAYIKVVIIPFNKKYEKSKESK